MGAVLLKGGIPNPGPWTGTISNQTLEQEVSSRPASEASFVFKATCMAHIIALLLFNNNRNKLRSKLSVLESSRHHSPS